MREELGLPLGGKERAIEQGGKQAGDLLVRERGQGERRGVGLPPAPARSTGEQLRAGRADDEHRNVPGPLDEMVDEVEQAVVRPLQVFEDEHEWAQIRERLEEAAPGGEGLVAAIGRGVGPSQADERTQMVLDPTGLLAVGHRLGDDVPDLLAGNLGGVGLEDACMRFHRLAERPERDPFAVGERPSLAPVDELVRVAVYLARELPDEPALADSGDADHGHQLHRALFAGPRKSAEQELELPLAADERGVRGLLEVDPEAGAGLDGPPDGDRLSLPLRLDSSGLLVHDRPRGGAERRLADEDAVDRRRGLEACSRVHDVSGHHRVAFARPRIERDERFARVHGDAHVEVEPGITVIEARDGVVDGERGADGSLGVILVSDRGPEDGDDRVADELLDGPPVALELPAHPPVVVAERRTDVLGIEPLRPSREVDEVGEEHRDDLPLLSPRRQQPRRTPSRTPGRSGRARRFSSAQTGQTFMREF